MAAQSGKQSFWDHLDALRAAIVKSLLVAVVFGVAAFYFKEKLFTVVLAPKDAGFITYRLLASIGRLWDEAEPTDFTVQLINTGLAEQFIIHMKTAMCAGILCYILYQLFRFVSPALYADKRKYAVRIVGSGYAMFLLGVLVSYFLIFPLTFWFLGTAPATAPATSHCIPAVRRSAESAIFRIFAHPNRPNMGNDCRHFIITRFNLNLYAQDKNRMPTRTAAWLEHRFELFERYCLPSVAAQSCKEFTWLCLFDAATPEPYRRRIAGYAARCPQFEAVYYDSAQALRLTESLRATLLALKGAGRPGAAAPELLLTTNLDNDDALAADAVELLRQALRPASGKRVYSFLYGYQYFTRARYALRMRYANNHFLSLAEPYDGNLMTIASYTHSRAIFVLPTEFIRTRRGKWLEIVHEDNVSNDFRINIRIRLIPMLRSCSFADFGLPGLRIPWPRQTLGSLFVFPAQALCTAVRRLWTKRQRHKSSTLCSFTPSQPAEGEPTTPARPDRSEPN